MTTATETKTKYYGIADCHGIECFHFKKDPGSFDKDLLVFRAGSNRHRHAVFYEVDLTEEQANAVRSLLAEADYPAALEQLKEHAAGEVSLAGGGNVEKSWHLIPNSDLDPWR